MKNKIISISLSLGLFLSLNVAFLPSAFAAVCTDQGLGSASNTYSFPAAGNKQVWLRMAGTATTSKRINVEVKDANGATTCLLTTNDTPTTNWVWKRAGGSTGKFTATTNNTLTLYGLDSGVRVDKIIAFDADRSCTPSNVFPGTLGDECLDPSTPPKPSTTTDTTAPVGPSALSASVVSQTQVNLSWPAASDNVGVTTYEIFRDGTKLNTVSSSTRSFSDPGLKAATVYNYKVIAKDTAGNSSTGAQATVTTLQATDTTAPSAPTGLSTGLSLDSFATAYYVNIKWTPSTDAGGIKKYDIFKNGVYVRSSTTASYKDYDLKPDSYYSYQVQAIDNSNNKSTLSNSTTFVGRCFLWFCWKG